MKRVATETGREPVVRGWARVLAWLDGFISEALRKGPPQELGRARLLVRTCGVLLPANILFLLYVPLTTSPLALGTIGGASAACIVATLGLLRWRASTRSPALLLCSACMAAIVLIDWCMGMMAVNTHVAAAMVPFMAVYLLGPRMGLVFVLVSGVNVGLLFPLFFAGSDFGTTEWILSGFAVVLTLCAWAVAWLFSIARDESSSELERAFEKLRKSQGELVSLLENTDDIACSLDTQGRVVTANAAFQRMYQELYAQEPRPGVSLLPHWAPVEKQVQWQEHFEQVLAGQRVRVEVIASRLGRRRVLELSLNPVRGQAEQVVGVTLFGRDVTERKESEARQEELHRNLVEVSRQAGMAEVATGVLHNVGNALNSVTVSATLVAEQLGKLPVSGLTKAVALLREHAGDLSTFLTTDAKGRLLPRYFQVAVEQLAREQESGRTEVRALLESVEHIKSVVAMQQAHARITRTVERVEVPALLDDALRLHALSFDEAGIQLRRDFAEVPPVVVERHKLLQILVNLLGNARHALLASASEDKQLTLRVQQAGERLRISVADNGVGIAPEHLPRIFSQGFTTKKNGHGFGLHISALAAQEMGGTLTCTSGGSGQGATFTLELPQPADGHLGTRQAEAH